MSWEITHMGAGTGVYGALYLACDGTPETALIIPAALISVVTHWPFDDLNIGNEAKVYHGIGETPPVKVLTTIGRFPVYAVLLWLAIVEPMMLACALPAWLALDHEWILIPFGKHGYGLHARMWPAWLKRQKGLIPWFIFYYVGALMIAGGLSSR